LPVHAEKLPAVRAPEIVADPEILSAYLEDASRTARGHASGLARPASEAEVASLLRETAGRALLIQGARSSLTGGATPRGELVVSVERMQDRGPVERGPRAARVTVQPGMRACDLQAGLAERGFYYPPLPTYPQATLGGTVATNAGGAAS
jgi:FAD/FMN-containing dehydrogenase